MTIRVKIENLEIGHAPIKVTKIATHPDMKHEGMTHEYVSESHELYGGDSVELYVWGDQRIEIKEGFRIG